MEGSAWGEAAVIDTVQSRLARIEKKLDSLLYKEPAPASEVVGIREIMRLTGTQSRFGAHRILKKLGVHPFVKGKYLRADLANAMNARTRADLAHDLQTEARVPSPKSHNPIE